MKNHASLRQRAWDVRSGRRAYQALKFFLRPILHLVYKIEVEGAEHVPAGGPAILASNHLSFCDSIFLPLVLPRRVTFVAKAEFFEGRRAWFFRMVGQIPIKRTGGSASAGALAAARDVLGAGELFGIYPEGTRSTDGFLHRGHTGMARLSLETGAPIVAVAMIGTDEALPAGVHKPRPFKRIGVKFSPPMRWENQRADDPVALRAITDEVMFELRELSGQTYVDSYMTKKAPVAADPEPAIIRSVESRGEMPQRSTLDYRDEPEAAAG